MAKEPPLQVETRAERLAQLAREDAPPRAYPPSSSTAPVRCVAPCFEWNDPARERCRVCGLPLSRG